MKEAAAAVVVGRARRTVLITTPKYVHCPSKLAMLSLDVFNSISAPKKKSLSALLATSASASVRPRAPFSPFGGCLLPPPLTPAPPSAPYRVRACVRVCLHYAPHARARAHAHAHAHGHAHAHAHVPLQMRAVQARMDADKALLSSTKKAVSIVASREKEWQEVRKECVHSLHADRGLVGTLIKTATSVTGALTYGGFSGGGDLEAELEAEQRALEETRHAISEAHGVQHELIPWMHRKPAAGAGAAGMSIQLEAAQRDLQDTRVQLYTAKTTRGADGAAGAGAAGTADQLVGVASLRATVAAGSRINVSASVSLEAAIEEERRLLAELRVKLGSKK